MRKRLRTWCRHISFYLGALIVMSVSGCVSVPDCMERMGSKTFDTQINSVAIDRESKRLLVGGCQGDVYVWDCPDGRVQRVQLPVTGLVCSVEFMENGRDVGAVVRATEASQGWPRMSETVDMFVVTSMDDNMFKTNVMQRVVTASGPMRQAFALRGDKAFICHKQTGRGFSAESMIFVVSSEQIHEVSLLDLRANAGDLLAGGVVGNEIFVVGRYFCTNDNMSKIVGMVGTNMTVISAKPDRGVASPATVSADGRYLVLGGIYAGDVAVTAWELPAKNKVFHLFDGLGHGFMSVAMLMSGGRYMIVAGEPDQLRLIDLSHEPPLVQKVSMPGFGFITALASKDDIVAIAGNQRLELWRWRPDSRSEGIGVTH